MVKPWKQCLEWYVGFFYIINQKLYRRLLKTDSKISSNSVMYNMFKSTEVFYPWKIHVLVKFLTSNNHILDEKERWGANTIKWKVLQISWNKTFRRWVLLHVYCITVYYYILGGSLLFKILCWTRASSIFIN